MNTIDIIILVVLLYAVVKGWTGGILVQLAGIAGIVAGIWAASYFSDRLAEVLGMEALSHEAMFIVTLVIVMVAVALLMKLLDKLLKSVGLSLPLRILGVLFSLAKWTVLLTLVLSVYLSVVRIWRIAPSEKVTESIFYEPLNKIKETVFPYLRSMADDVKLPVQQEKGTTMDNIHMI